MTPKEEQEFHAKRLRESMTDLRAPMNQEELQKLNTREQERMRDLRKREQDCRDEMFNLQRIARLCKNSSEPVNMTPQQRAQLVHDERVRLDNIERKRMDEMLLEPDAPRLTLRQAIGTMGAVKAAVRAGYRIGETIEAASVVNRPWDTQPMPEQGPPPPVKYSCFGGEYSNQFHTEQDYADYKADIHEAEMRAYHRNRVKYGVWAGNQNKYVSSPDQLNEWDGRTMENHYAAWCREQGL